VAPLRGRLFIARFGRVRTAGVVVPWGWWPGWEVGVFPTAFGIPTVPSGFAILPDLPVAGAFGVDAFGAVLFSGAVAARHL